MENCKISSPNHKAVYNVYCASGTFGGFSGPNELYSQFDPNRYYCNIIRVHTSPDLNQCVNELVDAIIKFNGIENNPIILIGWSQGGYTAIRAVEKLKSNYAPLYKKVKVIIIISSRPEGTDFVSEMTHITKYIICANLDTPRRINGAHLMYDKACSPKKFITIESGTHNYEDTECFHELTNIVRDIISNETQKLV